MNGLLKKAGLGVALAATALTAAAPADAQRYRRYHRGGGDVATGAILGGIVGLGVGAAIASNNRNRYYYDDGYYYGPPPRTRGYYYAPPPPPRVVYRDYYAPRYYAPPPRYYGDYGYRGYYGY